MLFRSVPVAHVDMDHPSVSETDGIPVFLPQGGESPYLERMNSILGAIYTGHEQARQLSQVLVGLELIESVTLNVEFEDGSRMSLEGLFSVNEEKFRQLDASVLGKLHQGGHLQSVFMMFASLLNVGRLIARKNRHLAISRAAV